MAVSWLAEVTDYHDSTELIERDTPTGQADFLVMRHFTAAWVARALALGSAWADVNPTALHLAENKVLQAVGPDGLWRWGLASSPSG